MAIDTPSELKARSVRAEIGCLLVAAMLWWPLVAVFVVVYSISVVPLIEPFSSNFATVFVPTMLAMNLGIGSIMREFRSNENVGWRIWFRRFLPLLPFSLAVALLNIAATFFLQWAWEWHGSNRYAFILVWAFVIGVIVSACTYLLWRVLRYPMLSPNQSSSPEQ